MTPLATLAAAAAWHPLTPRPRPPSATTTGSAPRLSLAARPAAHPAPTLPRMAIAPAASGRAPPASSGGTPRAPVGTLARPLLIPPLGKLHHRPRQWPAPQPSSPPPPLAGPQPPAPPTTGSFLPARLTRPSAARAVCWRATHLLPPWLIGAVRNGAAAGAGRMPRRALCRGCEMRAEAQESPRRVTNRQTHLTCSPIQGGYWLPHNSTADTGG